MPVKRQSTATPKRLRGRALFGAVKRTILEEPARLFMPTYLIRRLTPALAQFEGIKEVPRCGTVGCIAGWACLLAGEPDPDCGHGRAARYYLLAGNASGQALRELSLLFQSNPDWWEREGNARARARAAAREIDYFVARWGGELAS